MKNEKGNKVVGGIMLVALVFMLMCLFGAFGAIVNDQFIGAGIILLAGSLPITAAVYGILFKK